MTSKDLIPIVDRLQNAFLENTSNYEFKLEIL